jgi:hypothetical protein
MLVPHNPHLGPRPSEVSQTRAIYMPDAARAVSGIPRAHPGGRVTPRFCSLVHERIPPSRCCPVGRRHAIDIAAQIAHLPLRVYVMGDRAIRLEPASTDDIAEMRRLTIEALRAGA